jgi:hypothetical protein
MASLDTVSILAREVGLAFRPLADGLSDPDSARDFLERLGWQFATAPLEVTALSPLASSIVAIADKEDISDGEAEQLVQLVAQEVLAIANLASSTTLPDDFKAEFPRQLVDYLVVEHLFAHRPAWAFFLYAIGIIRYDELVLDNREPFTRRILALEDLTSLLSDPLGYLKSSYSWGNSDFDGARLAIATAGLLEAWGLSVRESAIGSDVVVGLLNSGAVSPDDDQSTAVNLVLLEDLSDPTVEAGIGLFPLPETAVDRPGFALLPFASLAFEQAISISEGVSLSFGGQVDLTSPVGVFVRPLRDVQFLSGLDTGAPSPIAGEFSVDLTLAQPRDPIVVLGTPGASRVEFAGVSTRAAVRLAGQKREVAVELKLVGAKIVIDSSKGDSFINSLISAGGSTTMPLELGVGFSTTQGIYLVGSAEFAITIPAHVALGPIEVQTVTISTRPTGDSLPVKVTAALTAKLSAVTATIDGLGFAANIALRSDGKGNLGPVDVGLAFVPPTGIGIFIESSSVSGGGFLFFDEPNGRYGGAVELRAYSIDIKAFGLIETKVPGVSFSFVIVISAEFNPIQLGFGFTLNGVGGLIGINRTVNSDEVSKKLRDGTVDNILFPTNLIQNAPQIISDLAALFPAADSRYVFGPLAKLGWAGLVNGTIGVILELPSKAVTIIGNINAILPKPDNALVVLDMDIAGKLDFPKKHFELDATLSPNSKLGAYTITGDMATRIDWGDRPNFAISMGGFHSQFKPPPGFPRLRRMAIDLGIKGNPSVTLQGFMALTSNTAQVGAQLDIYASFGATLTGNVGFEAMFVFSPFSFDARLWGNVHVEFLGVGFGMTLNGRITGPSPWTIDGEVCVSLWFDSACVGIHKKLDGAPAPEPLPLLDPWFGFPANVALSAQEVPGLRPAIEDPRNWAGRLPAGALIGVSYVERNGREELVDPVGIATLRQKSVPLAYDITQYAGRAPSRKGPLNISSALVGDVGASFDYVTDWFAPGQYRKMSNEEALAAQPFEQLKAGVELQGKVAKVGSARARAVEYRTHVLDAQGNEVQAFNHMLPTRHLDGIQKSSSVARLSARLSGRTRFIDITQKRRMTDEIESFSLTSKLDLTLVGGIAKVTRSEAVAALEALAGPNAFKRQQYQIVGFHVVT